MLAYEGSICRSIRERKRKHSNLLYYGGYVFSMLCLLLIGFGWFVNSIIQTTVYDLSRNLWLPVSIGTETVRFFTLFNVETCRWAEFLLSWKVRDKSGNFVVCQDIFGLMDWVFIIYLLC